MSEKSNIIRIFSEDEDEINNKNSILSEKKINEDIKNLIKMIQK